MVGGSNHRGTGVGEAVIRSFDGSWLMWQVYAVSVTGTQGADKNYKRASSHL